jgi:hypothetical protein
VEHPEQTDDFAASAITRADDIRDLFVPNLYFGCEADDPINAWPFAAWAHPFGPTFNILLGSDIGHFDLPDMTEVLPEGYELVDKRLLSVANVRDFLFANRVRFWAGSDRNFFNGTTVQSAADAELAKLAAAPHP